MENTGAVPNLTKETEADRSAPIVECLERLIDALEQRKPVGLLIQETKNRLASYKGQGTDIRQALLNYPTQ